MIATKAYIVRPRPCPTPDKIPWVLPPSIVFLITIARLGPGEIAPEAQTNARIIIELLSNLF